MPKINELRFAKTDRNTPTPRRGSEKAAGLDLGLPRDVRIRPGGHEFVDMGIAFDIPEGHKLVIMPRSSACDRKGANGEPEFAVIIAIDNTLGLIDSDYTGSIKLKLTNNGWDTYLGYAGDFIVQAVLEEFVQIGELKEVDQINKVTDRGDKGFGSSDE